MYGVDKMKKGMCIFVVLVIWLFVVGCEIETRKEPYIGSVKQDPNILREETDLTLLYNIINPSDKSDMLYLEITIPEEENCLQFRGESIYTLEKRINLGEIEENSEKSFYTDFRVRDNTEGETCKLSLALYPSENSITSIYGLDVIVNIAQRT